MLGRRARIFGKEEDQRLDLAHTDLRGAQLLGAHLQGASLSGAQLEVEQLATVKTLYQAQLDPPLFEQIEQRYPHLLKEPQD